MSHALKNTLFAVVCLPLILLVAFRGDTRDTFNYLEVYRGLTEFPWSPGDFQDEYFMEWGFGLLAGSVKAAGLPPEILFLLVSGLTFFAIAKASVGFGLNAWSAIPFYLCTFFLTQQFMQIRQGLAVALAFWGISFLTRFPRSWLSAGVLSLAGALFHVVSLVSVAIALVMLPFTPSQRSYRNWIWAAGIFALIVAACWIISSTDLFALTARISNYIGDDEFAAPRSITEPANLRAILLTLAFLVFRPAADRPWFKTYIVLLGLYIANLGIRIGFIEIAILSGRIGSALGFAEIFLLPLVIMDRIQRPLWKSIVTYSYVAVHFAIALLILVPFLIEDYFRPLG